MKTNQLPLTRIEGLTTNTTQTDVGVRLQRKPHPPHKQRFHFCITHFRTHPNMPLSSNRWASWNHPASHGAGCSSEGRGRTSPPRRRRRRGGRASSTSKSSSRSLLGYKSRKSKQANKNRARVRNLGMDMKRSKVLVASAGLYTALSSCTVCQHRCWISLMYGPCIRSRCQI